MPTEPLPGEWKSSDASRFVHDRLSAVSDPDKAVAMAAYMKHQARFYGVAKPVSRPILRELNARFSVSTCDEYDELIRVLWANEMREARYMALGVANRWKTHQTITHMPLFEQLIVEGAWWDVVDDVAVHLVGRAVRRDPVAGWSIIDRWVAAEDMWLRRTAIICQLEWKADTDVARLLATCAALAHEKEFFIRKAIGWALRQYARTDAECVRSFVVGHRDELSGLSIREATKHTGRI